MSDTIADAIRDIVSDANTGQATIKFNAQTVSDVTRRAKPYKAFPETARVGLEKVADYVRLTMIPETFHKEGPGWRQLSRRTRQERAAQGYNPRHPILIRSRDLYRELTDKGHPRHVEIIKTGKDARITIGGSSEKFVRNQLGNRQFNIPPRRMVPGGKDPEIPAKDQQAIQGILERAIREAFNRNG